MKEFQLGCNQRGLCPKGSGRQDKQLNTYDWLADIPGNDELSEFVEVQFKNTRKDYYVNSNHLTLNKGDMVAVESSPGHDIGVVTLTGSLVPLQMKKIRLRSDAGTKRVYRLAKDVDLQKFEEAKTREYETMIKSRQISKELGLDMKIGDVEYQGDGNKAIFYYIADQRVDFRQLIKVLAEEFRVRIEMKQIGARQEAGRIGGIGPCGRELCCATWMKNFVTVSTNVARQQDVSLNPQKLAGQCAKLKCCLNYEVSTYAEAASKLPPREMVLETSGAMYYYLKADILAGLVSYSTDKHLAENVVTISTERAQTVMKMNRNGQKPENLLEEDTSKAAENVNLDLAIQESLTRFDKGKKKKNHNRNRNQNQNQNQQQGAPREEQRNASNVQSKGDSTDQKVRKDRRTDERRNNNRPWRNRPNRPERDGDRRVHGDPKNRNRGDERQKNPSREGNNPE